MTDDRTFRIVSCAWCGKNRQVNFLFDASNRMYSDDQGCECVRHRQKVEVTYSSFRGMGGDSNFYPAKEWVLLSALGAANLEEAQKSLRANGFYRTYNSGTKVYVPPSAIIEVRMATKLG